MSKGVKLLVIGGTMIVLGIVLFVLPTPGAPELECATDPLKTSGFVIEDKDCPSSIESQSAYNDWNSKPKWDNIGGLAVVLVGLGVGVAGVVALVRRPKVGRTFAAPPR